MGSLVMPSTSTLYLDEFLDDRPDDSRERLEIDQNQRDLPRVPVHCGEESAPAELQRDGGYSPRTTIGVFVSRAVVNKRLRWLLVFLVALVLVAVVVAVAVPLALRGRKSHDDR